ncbi:MAG: hypothetical protein FWF60_09330 [Oscillospiraceae bacterium]|nr:hypothetical protein [Oscillospiraceae bacterium]
MVKSSLGLTNTVGFIDSVASTVIDGETGEYRPELFDFAFDAMVLMYFTNIALPEDAGEQFELVCHTDLCFEVKRSIDTEQLECLRAAAERKVAHLLHCAENTLASKMTDLLASFEQLRESTHDVFSNIGGADLKAMVNHLSGMDEAALAKAVLARQGDADAR